MLKILGWSIYLLALYNGIFFMILGGHSRQKITEKGETTTKKSALQNKLQVIATVIAIGICIALFMVVIVKKHTWILWTGVLMFSFISILWAEDVGSIFLSSKKELTRDEEKGLGSIGTIIGGWIAYAPVETWLKEDRKTPNLSWRTDIQECGLIILIYAICIFFLVALAIRPIKDIAKIVAWCMSKLYLTMQCIMGKIGVVYSTEKENSRTVELYFRKTQNHGWRKIANYIAFYVSVCWDTTWYVVKYMLMVLLTPLLLGVLVVRDFLECGKRISKKMIELPGRKVTILSLKISIIAAMLIVVIQNRLYHIVSSEDATAILEFIASVIIIPILFEWISSATQKAVNE